LGHFTLIFAIFVGHIKAIFIAVLSKFYVIHFFGYSISHGVFSVLQVFVCVCYETDHVQSHSVDSVEMAKP